MTMVRRREKIRAGRHSDSSPPRETKYLLRLYVTGVTPRSTRAIENIRKICEEHLKGRYDLEVVDIYQQITLARDEQIIAAPTLLKKLPLPLRRIVGDLSDKERVLVGLDVRPHPEAAAAPPRKPARAVQARRKRKKRTAVRLKSQGA
jgi:circadian clock protein KaiB